MQTTIQKWENSQGIRIPKAFLEAAGMMENDIVELNRVNDSIVITKGDLLPPPNKKSSTG